MRRFYDNPRAKEQTNSFYLQEELLELLRYIAEIEGQSRNVIIERCLYFARLHQKKEVNDEKLWQKSHQKYKKKKKIHAHQNGYRAYRQAKPQSQSEQKCLFGGLYL